VAREFGISRKTISKMLRYSVPPGYQRQQPVRRPKLGPWLGVIDAILKDDKTTPAKQRHTAKRIFERLKEEHGFSGGYTIVKDYVRGEELRGREMFVPLVHPPGEAQADFGEALVVIAGVEQKAHFLAMDCPHSDDGFVAAFPGETTEAFQQGHVLAFEHFGAVPTRILYDNTKIAVSRILGGEERTKTKAFLELQSHYLFADKFGRPGNLRQPAPARSHAGRPALSTRRSLAHSRERSRAGGGSSLDPACRCSAADHCALPGLLPAGHRGSTRNGSWRRVLPIRTTKTPEAPLSLMAHAERTPQPRLRRGMTPKSKTPPHLRCGMMLYKSLPLQILFLLWNTSAKYNWVALP
jgi:transposase